MNEIVTERLLIRNFEIEDASSCLVGWGRDRNLGKYILGYPAEEHQMEAFVSAWAENENAWVIVEKVLFSTLNDAPFFTLNSVITA